LRVSGDILTLLLEILEKSADQGGVELLQGQCRGRDIEPLGGKLENGVTISRYVEVSWMS